MVERLKVKSKIGKEPMHKEMPYHEMPGGKPMPGAKHPAAMPPKMPMKGGKKGR